MRVGIVRELWRYPVKSMRGERLGEGRVGIRGIAHDRGYALLDAETGKVASAKHPRLWGILLRCQARMAPEREGLCITFPDGSELLTHPDDAGVDEEADEAFSRLTGRPVHLVRTPPAVAEIERYWPDVEGLALRDTTTSGKIGQGAPSGTFFDHAPLHLMTTSTLAHLGALYPSGQVDARRFRPNLVIGLPDTEPLGFAENAWVGQFLQIGRELRLRVTDPTPRCVVPTLPQGELTEDIGVLRAVAQHNRPPVPALGGARMPSLGVYASIEQEGKCHAGDEVWLAS